MCCALICNDLWPQARCVPQGALHCPTHLQILPASQHDGAAVSGSLKQDYIKFGKSLASDLSRARFIG